MLLADEPLSGLDSFTARTVMQSLKDLASTGRTIIVSVHQPRSEIWEVRAFFREPRLQPADHSPPPTLQMFDNVLLLAKGGVTAFSGPRSAILKSFEAVGESCPPHHKLGYVHCSPCSQAHSLFPSSPADFILDTISVDYRSTDATASSKARVDRILGAWRDRKATVDSVSHGSEEKKPPLSTAVMFKRRPAPLLVAFPVIFHRSALNLWRAKDAAIARIMNPPFLALLFWIFFARLGYGPSSAQDRVGLLQQTTAMPFVGE